MSFDLEAYLARIGVSRADVPRADLDALDRLVWGHLTHVPFENLDILLDRPIAIDLESVFAQLVTRRRGGYCYQHNTLFAAALAALGFTVVPLAARVGETRESARLTHMLLEVRIADTAYLADVGFGGNCPTRAVPFELGDHASRHGTLRMRDDGDGYLALDLEGYDTLYWFTRQRQYPSDYEVANYYTSTCPGSYFVTGPRVSIIIPTGYRGYSDGVLTVRERGVVSAKTPVAAADVVAMLAEQFGLVFPAGTSFRGVA